MKIMISASNGFSLINFRGDLIKEMIKKGHEVICTSIESEAVMKEAIHALGAKYYCIPGTRTGIHVGSNLKMLNNYKKAYRHFKPELCFIYMSKPIAFGGTAAIFCGIKQIIVFVTGLEVAFYSPGLKNRLIRFILKKLYKFVHKKSQFVFLMNHDDYNKMMKWKLIEKEKAVLINGSGVNMDYYKKTPMPETDLICMAARLVWSKGIKEYVEAATLVQNKFPLVKFLLIGDIDENPEALLQSELKELVDKNIVEYGGFVSDVRPYLKACSIFVLPSYHEGNGRSIVEAEAVGRPIITTTAPGCKETVIDGYNGFLIPIKDGKTLAEKIMILLENKELKINMAENSYQLCLEKYDVKKINKILIEKMEL